MSLNSSCPRCQKTLPEITLRALSQGTTCPFCAAPLKRTPKRGAAAAPADDGYATFEVSAPAQPAPAPAPPPAAAKAPPPAPAKAAPIATTAASQRSFKATMVGGTAVAAREKPFEGTLDPKPFSLAPPVSAPAPVATTPRAPEPPAQAATAAALARTMVATATSPSRTPSTRATLAPAAGRPARTLTPAQALDLPPPTPAPVLKTPPPIVYAAPPRAAAVRPLVTETDSGPTRVSPQHARGAAAPGPLVTESESGPTNVVLSPSMVTEIAPVLTFPDSDAIIDSVTMEPEAEQPAAAPLSAPAAFTLPAPETPRRGTALMALGMGLGIVVIAFVGFKLLRGSKAPVSPVTVATNATPPEPVEPVVQAPQPAPVAEEPAPPPKAALAARSKTAATPSTIAPQPVARAAVPRAIVETHEVDRPAAERHAAAPHRRVAAHKPKAHERASHKRSLAMREPAAKRNPTAAAPEHSDPRPLYEHGNALLFAGDGKGAIAAYRDAVKNAPSDPIGFRGLGLAYEQQGEPALAIRALRRYLKLAPDAPDRELISKRIDKLSKRAKSK